MDTYETAVFTYSEDGAGRYLFMATRINRSNEELRRKGYEDGHVIFIRFEGTFNRATWDAEALAAQVSAHDDDTLVQVLTSIRDGEIDFDELNGRVFHQHGVMA